MSPFYVRSEWVHNFEDQPYLIYSEVGDDNYEIRKIEVFKDGSIGKASEENPEVGSTGLSDQPSLSIEEINALPGEEFSAQQISAAEFNKLWDSSE